MEQADLILRNGEIIVLDKSSTIAQALAVKDGKVLKVGSNDDISKLAGPDTDFIDLDGKAVTPGLISTHDHFLQHGLSAEFILDIRYPKVRSCSQIAEAIAERVEGSEKGKWIIATGWDETLLEERRFPNRWDLDPVSPDNPVWIRRVFQMGVANSRALEAAGITKDTPDPHLGRIDRDEGGEPTGLLRGRAMQLVVDAIPPWTLEEMERGIGRACDDFLAQGMTTIIEPGILMPQLEAYRSLYLKGWLTIRSFIQYGFLHDPEEVEEALDKVEVGGDDHLRVIGLKFAIDGGVGPRTALMYEPFEGEPENRGMQHVEAETLKEITLMGHEAGFQIAIHAIGDRAIDLTMDAYEGGRPKEDRGARRRGEHPSPLPLLARGQLHRGRGAGARSPVHTAEDDAGEGNTGREQPRRDGDPAPSQDRDLRQRRPEDHQGGDHGLGRGRNAPPGLTDVHHPRGEARLHGGEDRLAGARQVRRHGCVGPQPAGCRCRGTQRTGGRDDAGRGRGQIS
jgi:predicted amidohydrolase YtcJ